MNKQFQGLLIFTAIIIYLLLSHSCANPGAGPAGGPKDSIPPVILNMVPAPYATNVKGNEIIINFDEYVVQDNLASKMVVSPPLADKPTIRLKGKTIHIKFTEDLIPDRTYSVDLKDGIKDYNEGNKIESIRMLFSTYDNIDTLQIKGFLLDAFTLNPVKDAYATLYTLTEDSIFSTLRPDFIAKTDEEGYFLFDNLPQGNYKLYGLSDLDNNLMYTQISEQIAFIDSFIVPSAEFIVTADTIFEENDTIIDPGHTQYWPNPIFAYMFNEDVYNQFITGSSRDANDRMLVAFNESITDSFKVALVGIDESVDSKYMEISTERDSVYIWLTDTLIIHNDSLFLRVDYTALDTLNQYVTTADTLKMYFSSKATKAKSKKKEAEEPAKTLNFEFTSNLTSNNFDLFKDIEIEAPSPIEPMDTSMIHLAMVVNDSVSEKVPYQLMALTESQRKYRLTYQAQEATKYMLSIDSAAVITKSGLSNLTFESGFKTQKADYYGTAIFEITGLTEPAKIMLLQNSEKEAIIKEQSLVPGNNTITFNYLKPSKYRVKIFIDRNENGKWDTGNLAQKVLPEPVLYFSKVVNIKSNWELKENWDIDTNLHEIKNIIDDDKKKDEE